MKHEIMKTLLLMILVLLLPLQIEARKRELGKARKVVRGFSAIDTSYIEPQHYNFTVMLQSTFNYDFYRLASSNGDYVDLSPDVIMRVGPYVGWRWFFLGYTFELKNLGVSEGKLKKEFNFYIYSSQIGIDLFYRRTGSDYKIRNAGFGPNVNANRLEGVAFDGVNVGITGINTYYIFNHNRFSYPAAFSQSTCQKISCGSWIAGLGYTRNSLEFDSKKLEALVQDRCDIPSFEVDSGMKFNKVNYWDVSLSGGYAYNWVFARNCLFCASAQLALAYKRSHGNTESNSSSQGFHFNNINLDGIGRFGIVYNNTRWYAGASAILHTNNYRKERFETYNVFGCLNIYTGYNFGIKPRYRKKK